MPPTKRTELRARAYTLVAVATAALVAAAPATAAVTATVVGTGSDGLLVRGDDAQDTIRVTCGADGNVAVNDAPPAGSPLACAATRSIDVAGGPALDNIRLHAVKSPAFAEPLDIRIDNDPSDPLAAAGSDFIRASGFADEIGSCVVRTTGIYDDNVAGGAGDDIICGGDDRDFLRGLGGDDLIDGGRGEDDIYGSGGDDRLFGRAGPDFFRDGPGNDFIRGGPGFDQFFDGPGDDVVRD